jgi:hypothetical protein
MPTTAQSDSVLELYSAYFNRAADAGGFTFWKNSFDTYFNESAGNSAVALQKIAVDMSTSAEYKANYPATQSSTEFVKAIYVNLLDRADPNADAEGVAFWVGHIDAGTLTKEQAINNIIEGAKANTTAQGKLDAALIVNKNAVSKYFAETLKSDNVELAKNAFSKVTAEVASVKIATDFLDKDGAIQLTSEEDAFTGTATADTFSSADGTLQAGDIILDTTKDDADTLNIDMLIYEPGNTANITGIETINVKSVTNQVGFEGDNIKGVNVLNIDSTSAKGLATVTGVSAEKIASIVTGDNITTANITAYLKGTGSAAVEVSASKATTIELKGSVKDDAFTLKTAAANADIMLGTSTGTAGDNTYIIEDGINAKSIKFDGSTSSKDDILILKGSSKATAFDLNAGEGDNTFSIATADKALTSLKLNGSASGTDKYTINLNGTATNGSAELEITGSDIDELVFNSQTAPTVLKLVNANPLVKQFDAGATPPISGGKVVLLGDQDITFMGDAAAFANVNLVDASPATSTLKINTGSGADLTKLAFNMIDIAKITGDATFTVHEDAMVKLSGTNTNNLIIQSTTANDALDMMLAASQATLTSGIATQTNITVTANSTINEYANAVSNSTTMVTGDKVLVIKSLNMADSGSTFDASALTGRLTATLSDTNNAKITAGTAGDIIKGSANADTIDGGAGNDTLTGNAGIDILTGGEGKDTFIIQNGGIDNITDFTSVDDTLKISLSSIGKLVDGTGTTITTSSSFFLAPVTKATTLTAAQGVIVLKGQTFAPDGAAMEVAIETGAMKLTMGGAITDNNDILVAWNDTQGHAHISSINMVTSTSGTTANLTAASSHTDLIVLTGTDVTSLTQPDFDFI